MAEATVKRELNHIWARTISTYATYSSHGPTVGQTFGHYDAPQDNPLVLSLENNHSDLFLQRVLGISHVESALCI